MTLYNFVHEPVKLTLFPITNSPSETTASVVVQPEKTYPSALRASATFTVVPASYSALTGAVTPEGTVPSKLYVTVYFSGASGSL